MLATEMPVAKSTVTNDPLRRLLAFLVRAPDLLGRHATTKREGEVYCRLSLNVAVLEST